ncbi:MAG: 6,7-dimethyl-8-ribityllumazine synthase [Vicinamibacterales bacterium]
MTAPVALSGDHQDPSGRYAVVVSRFNDEVTTGLLQGALDTLGESGVADGRITVIHVPGAYEIPLAARRAGTSGLFDAVICLGCLIKGDTMHFEYIADAATRGIADAAAATGVPMAFGVLTTVTDEQALIRSRPGPENKGREAALAAVEMVTLLRKWPAAGDAR